jgi:integrase
MTGGQSGFATRCGRSGRHGYVCASQPVCTAASKAAPKGRPTARRPARQVPIPPQLVTLLRDHLQAYGTAPDGRLFRSERGTPLQPSAWWQV